MSASNECRVGVVISWRKGLETRLEGFRKPKFCRFVGILNEFCPEGKPHPEAMAQFDQVFWYQNPADNAAMLDVENVHIQEIEVIFTERILRSYEREQIRIIVLGEYLVSMGARLRLKHGIPGPKPDDILPFINKLHLKQRAAVVGIPIPKSAVLNNRDGESFQKALEEIGSFPIFVKPISGVGSAGCFMLEDQETALETFQKEMQKTPSLGRRPLLLEEFLGQGTEIWASGIGRRLLWVELAPPGRGLFQAIRAGEAAYLKAFNDIEGEAEAPGISAFVSQVTEKLSFPQSSTWCIQVFQRSQGPRFVVMEICIRLPAPKIVPTLLENTGRNIETIHLLAGLEPAFVTLETLQSFLPAVRTGRILFFKRPGIMKREFCEFHARKLHGSRLEFQWNLEDGEEVEETSRTLRDFVCTVMVSNPSLKGCLADMEYLAGNWHPIADISKTKC